MTTWRMRMVCAVLALAPAVHADDKTAHKMAAKGEAVLLNANELKWGPAPPDLPKGAQLVVLHGDPTKPGPFTMRLKAPDGYKIPPHWHTQDENLTIISGTLVMYMGDTWSVEPHDLDVAAYHFLPGKMHHAAAAKGETVIQINGQGPFDIHYLNPADNPNPKTATR